MPGRVSTQIHAKWAMDIPRLSSGISGTKQQIALQGGLGFLSMLKGKAPHGFHRDLCLSWQNPAALPERRDRKGSSRPNENASDLKGAMQRRREAHSMVTSCLTSLDHTHKGSHSRGEESSVERAIRHADNAPHRSKSPLRCRRPSPPGNWLCL